MLCNPDMSSFMIIHALAVLCAMQMMVMEVMMCDVGLLAVIAGGFNDLYSDGIGTNASFNAPQDLFVTSDGSILVLDTWNDVIRKIEINGE